MIQEPASGQVIAELPIGPELTTALLERAGPLGDLLARVVAYERADFAAAAAFPLDPATTTQSYIEAVDWSTRLTGSLAA